CQFFGVVHPLRVTWVHLQLGTLSLTGPDIRRLRAMANEGTPARPAPEVTSALPPLSHYAKATAVVLGVLGIAAAAWIARGVLLTILTGFLLAAGLDPLVKGLERRGMRRGAAVLVLVLSILLLIVLFLWLGLRPAIAQAVEFTRQIPEL